MTIILVMLIVLAGLFAAGWYFSEKVINIPTIPVEETYRLEVENGKLDPRIWGALPRQEVRLRSPFGYEMFGIFVPVEAARGTVVIVHGVTYSLYGSFKYLDLFRRRGWNVLLYDHRAHGRSGGRFKTYGFFEKHDLKVWVDWARAQGGPVGLHGESYGAATVLQALPLLGETAFVVSDCAFSDLSALLAYHLRADFGLPPFPLLGLASLVTRLRAGFFFGQVRPVRGLTAARAPILFVHGEADDFTPTEMARRLHDAYEGPKALYIAPGAGHGDSFWSNPAEYDRQVGAFLSRFGLG